MKRESILRREFLKKAGQGLISISCLSFFSPGCRRSELSGDYDLVIRQALVFDGSGQPPFRADVGISGNYIKYIGKIGKNSSRRELLAEDLCLSPGFIDVHNHTDIELLVCPTADSLIRQGVTTVIGGNCGSSRFPLTPAMLQDEDRYLSREFGLKVDWQDLAGFFRRLEAKGQALNFATLVGQGTIRAAVVGYNNRPPSAQEMDRMKELASQALQQGAIGISTGLEYAPGSFASTGELIDLMKVLRGNQGIYATHMRDEEDEVLPAVDEALNIAEQSRVRLEISHLKIGFPRNWPLIDQLLEKLNQARARGVDFSADVYPYTAWSTGLSIFFPLWVREGKNEDFLNRLRSPELEPKLREAINQAESNLGSWNKVLIASVETEKNRQLEGLDLEQAAKGRNQDQDMFLFIRDLLLEERGQVSMVCFGLSEDNLKKILQQPFTCLGSDGEVASTTGPLSKGKPHPRYYGTFPRALAEYVRKEKVVPLETMIRKMTGFPAERFNLKQRGLVKPGYLADLVLFDYEKIQDKATWSDPHHYPEGIPYVLVNGKLVVDEGQITGQLPGKILRNDGRGQVI
ncbi:MAG TPA: D-aminoacylase [Candidatus Saccharicenans sp.]|nr:D-aminoacylase [Candidatus Saccharicenans sp.]HQM74111.1 D-aminoacylase [Candidatus Saccharicenans sp.]